MGEVESRQRVVAYTGGRLAIGRNRSNELVLEDPSVSRFHAEIVSVGEVVELRDLRSEAGTTLRGRQISRGVIRHGDEFTVGEVSLRLEAPELSRSRGREPVGLRAEGLAVTADGQPILDRVSATIAPGELI
jgi:pSer/pThr/pTyr-binding forkhead associated (FHA) protein